MGTNPLHSWLAHTWPSVPWFLHICGFWVCGQQLQIQWVMDGVVLCQGNLHINWPTQIKSVLFKSHLYLFFSLVSSFAFTSLVNLCPLLAHSWLHILLLYSFFLYSFFVTSCLFSLSSCQGVIKPNLSLLAYVQGSQSADMELWWVKESTTFTARAQQGV